MLERLRKYSGYFLLFISCVLWGVLPFIPFFYDEISTQAFWASSTFLAAEITWWMSILLLGKEFLDWLKRSWLDIKLKVRSWFV